MTNSLSLNHQLQFSFSIIILIRSAVNNHLFLQSGSIYGSSDLILDSTQSRLLQQRKILMKEEKRKRFWKSFAILLSVLLVAAIVVALSIYITHGRSTIVRTSWLLWPQSKTTVVTSAKPSLWPSETVNELCSFIA